MVTPQKEGVGLAKDIINLCLLRMGYQAEYKELPVKRTHHYMEIGDIDITIYSYKDERKEILYYSTEELFNAEYAFMVREGSDIKINRLADLTPYVIGNLAGLSYTPELKKIIDDKAEIKEVVTGYSLQSMFAQLLANTPRFDIMADSKNTLYWEAKKLGVMKKIKILDYKIKSKPYYITVSKRSKNIQNPEKFLARIDLCLRDIKKNSEYKTILASYGIH